MTTVRAATADDASLIAAIHVASWRVAYRDLLPAEFLDSLCVATRTQEWSERLRQSSRSTFVIETESAVRGWASVGASRDPDASESTGELFAIYIDPGFFGLSLGSKLLQACEVELLKGAFSLATLWVLERNSIARQFYEKAGFEPDNHHKTILIGGTEVREMRYAKRLTL